LIFLRKSSQQIQDQRQRRLNSANRATRLVNFTSSFDGKYLSINSSIILFNKFTI